MNYSHLLFFLLNPANRTLKFLFYPYKALLYLQVVTPYIPTFSRYFSSLVSYEPIPHVFLRFPNLKESAQ